jgi:hypothetical protein
MDRKEFLRKVWGNHSGWGFIAYKRDDQFITKAYKYPEQLTLLVTEVNNYNQWADIYFCVHLCKEKKRTKEHALNVNALWLDKDSGPQTDITIPPSILWETSRGRCQALWLLDTPMHPNEAETLNKKIAYGFKGDTGKWALTTYLRFPKSINYKYDEPFQGTFKIGEDEPVRYTASAFSGLDNVQTAPVIDLSVIPADLPTMEDVIKEFGNRISRIAWELLRATPQPKDDWSTKLWQLNKLLFEAGLPKEAIFVIAENSPWNKYRRDQRPREHLWLEISKASFAPPAEEREPTGLPWVGMETLMAHHERPQWLVKDIWMAKNVGFIAGVGKSYKSIHSLDLALSIASGEPFLGQFEILDPGPVLMIQEEDPLWRVSFRLQNMMEQKGLTAISISDDWEINVTPPRHIPLYVSIGGQFTFMNEEKVRAMEETIERIRPKMIFMDPLFMLIAGYDEYKAGDITIPLNLMKEWRNKYGCAISVVHHFKKAEGSAVDRLYGSMALYAWSENSLFLTKETPDSNRVLIERNIKDAMFSDKIQVEIFDIDESYQYEVRLSGDGEQDATGKVVQFLRTCAIGEPISRKNIIRLARVSPNTATRVIELLEAEGVIIKQRMGVGGQVYVTPLPRINLPFEVAVRG